MVNISVIAKNIIELTIGFALGNIPCTPTSNVVAAVRGIAKRGPKHVIITIPNITLNFLPIFMVTSLKLPLCFAIITIISNASPTSPITNPVNELIHSLPLEIPR